MEAIKIILLCILAAITYGIIHDQITARICVEYFTVGHPPVFHTDSPTLLGLGWGVIATWWVGLFLGIPLALSARCGSRTRLMAAQLFHPILKLLAVMGCAALFVGLLGYILAARGTIQLPEFMAGSIPPNHRVRFMADWWAHSVSYLSGFIGGVVVIVWCWRKRRDLTPEPALS